MRDDFTELARACECVCVGRRRTPIPTPAHAPPPRRRRGTVRRVLRAAYAAGGGLFILAKVPHVSTPRCARGRRCRWRRCARGAMALFTDLDLPTCGQLASAALPPLAAARRRRLRGVGGFTLLDRARADAGVPGHRAAGGGAAAGLSVAAARNVVVRRAATPDPLRLRALPAARTCQSTACIRTAAFRTCKSCRW